MWSCIFIPRLFIFILLTIIVFMDMILLLLSESKWVLIHTNCSSACVHLLSEVQFFTEVIFFVSCLQGLQNIFATLLICFTLWYLLVTRHLLLIWTAANNLLFLLLLLLLYFLLHLLCIWVACTYQWLVYINCTLVVSAGSQVCAFVAFISHIVEVSHLLNPVFLQKRVFRVLLLIIILVLNLFILVVSFIICFVYLIIVVVVSIAISINFIWIA